MPNTANRAYTYPASTANTNLWEHFEELAEDIDADVQLIHNGWADYISDFEAQSGSSTIGNAVVLTRYKQVGKTVHVAGKFTWGTTSNASGLGWLFLLPTPARSTEALFRVGSAYCRDSSAAALGHFPAICVIDTSNPSYVYLVNGTQVVGGTHPFTVASTDHVSFAITYEAA
jgi:hypothetical protein